MKKALVIILIGLISLNSFGQKVSKKDYLVTMETSKGTMHLILFDETPLHKSNFLKLAKEEAYDGTIFHRVIKEFMIQGGNLATKTDAQGTRSVSVNHEEDRIPYEFVPEHVHIKGALAAARTNNPKKESSFSQFYIVTGKKYSAKQMQGMKAKSELDYTDEQVKAYQELGGTPFLDNNYTVFGQVIDGIETTDKIEKVETSRGDKPTEDITMKVSVKKMRKKKITKMYGYQY
ncbi:peptidylprolyl isomerase [Arcticibacterium luteifluviistationis]|uniref:peptidylprolyl isomerase n=1 Tax=Arcticibacterium luteifluviistationis TaxID=1784714 RepID=A0A2Z4GAU4_9BACT|nr:peptidylprolyl isomerase [Arcticibacterium luteifluviistationis]AWV98327.1 peptidylprolyl isomerase [Arcticibacterium luteifluviistationis]